MVVCTRTSGSQYPAVEACFLLAGTVQCPFAAVLAAAGSELHACNTPAKADKAAVQCVKANARNAEHSTFQIYNPRPLAHRIDHF